VESHLATFSKGVLLVVATLLPIINPAGGAPIFLSFTEGANEKVRAYLAFRIARGGFFILVAAMFVGSHVLAFFGLSVPAVRIGGGLLVTAAGWRLLTSVGSPASEVIEWTPQLTQQRAFYPLTFPLTVGPGSIAVSITLGATLSEPGEFLFSRLGAALVGPALIAFAVYFSYRFADKLGKLLGDTGTTVFLRLSAFILLCVGVQIMWDGIAELLKPWLPNRG
jgi:multiple antibiotic resistance protein